mmetsp:Transcript_143277/g.445348  ORF Transcript_143277/g.445348 Transcript_143277/m.445348 type:complete len:200 (+) Transcript_143277:229-828(+)
MSRRTSLGFWTRRWPRMSAPSRPSRRRAGFRSGCWRLRHLPSSPRPSVLSRPRWTSRLCRSPRRRAPRTRRGRAAARRSGAAARPWAGAAPRASSPGTSRGTTTPSTGSCSERRSWSSSACGAAHGLSCRTTRRCAPGCACSSASASPRPGRSWRSRRRAKRSTIAWRSSRGNAARRPALGHPHRRRGGQTLASGPGER